MNADKIHSIFLEKAFCKMHKIHKCLPGHSYVFNRNEKNTCKCLFYGLYYEMNLCIRNDSKEVEGNMSNKQIIVSNVAKGHENPIAELVQVACQFDSNITFENDNRKINAKSIMGIMAFNPSKGMSVNIITEGNDEKEALLAMEKFLVCE